MSYAFMFNGNASAHMERTATIETLLCTQLLGFIMLYLPIESYWCLCWWSENRPPFQQCHDAHSCNYMMRYIYIYEYCILYVCAGWGGHMRKRASLFGWSDKAQSQHCLFALEESIAPGRKSKSPGSLHKKLKEKNKQRLMASLGNGSGAQGAAVTACWERLPRNWRSNCNDEEKKNWTTKGSKLR